MSNNKYKILIIEDESKIRSFISVILKANGYKPLACRTGTEAGLIFSSHKPDLCILDLGLPDMDGTELIKKIRAVSNTPILVLSARTAETDKVEALDLGANDYITKPFGTAELLARVRAALRTSCIAEPGAPPGKSFHVADLSIDYDKMCIRDSTGAGKTTIVNLISRFYDIQKGRILIDDYDLKKVSIESLRQQMGVMTQDNFLFSGTIRENIRYGRLDATDEEIIAAAKAVNAHDFIMKLEKGYDTELSERGGGLSIGQKQLLAFARTMVSDPRILILDEATSSIDTNTELLVQEGIEQLLKGRTSFVIAHRLSTIQKADRIFVIDDGRIIEEGNAQELMAKKGFYYDLYMSQFKNVV